MRDAVRVNGEECCDDKKPTQKYTTDCTKLVEVPYIEKVKTKVHGHCVQPAMEKRTIQVRKMVPCEKWKDVTETCIEIKEEKCTGYRTVWKPVEEAYEYVVKKPCKVEKTKRVPYTDYEERLIDMCIDVPVENKVATEGWRTDEVLKGKMVEVKQQEIWEMRPHRVGIGEVEVKDVDGCAETFGVCTIGKEEFDNYPPMPPRPTSHRGGYGGNSNRGGYGGNSNRGGYGGNSNRGEGSYGGGGMGGGGYGGGGMVGGGGSQRGYNPSRSGGATALNLNNVPKGYSAANSEYITSTERKRREYSQNQQNMVYANHNASMYKA